MLVLRVKYATAGRELQVTMTVIIIIAENKKRFTRERQLFKIFKTYLHIRHESIGFFRLCIAPLRYRRRTGPSRYWLLRSAVKVARKRVFCILNTIHTGSVIDPEIHVN